jgi:hypothetical protein
VNDNILSPSEAEGEPEMNLDTQIRLWTDLSMQAQLAENEPLHQLCYAQILRYSEVRHQAWKAENTSQIAYTPEQLLDMAGMNQWASIAALTQFRDKPVSDAAWKCHQSIGLLGTAYWWELVERAKGVILERVRVAA